MNTVLTIIRNFADKLRSTHTVRELFFFSACVLILLLVAVSLLFSPPRSRYLFYFNSAVQQSVKTEVRFLPKIKNTEDKLALFIEELLLGPQSPALEPLYPRGTSLISSMTRKGTAYINLSSSALMPSDIKTDPKKVYEVFKKNVCTNFRNIDRIYMYVDGIEVYSEIPGIAETEK